MLVWEVLFFLGLFFSFLLSPMDPDLGWQLRCGELTLKGQGLCSQNQFSSLLAGYRWTNHHRLYQILLFVVWKTWGFWGLSLLGGILVTLIFIIFNLIVKNYRLEKKVGCGSYFDHKFECFSPWNKKSTFRNFIFCSCLSLP